MNCKNGNNGQQKKMDNRINYSITMNGIESCSHGCVYCSAATTLNYAQGVNKENVLGSLEKIDEKTYSEFVADFPKLEETLEHNSRFINAKKIQEKQGIQCQVHIDMWGGDPVTNHLATQEVVAFLEDFFIKKHGMKLKINTSTGGIPLARTDICDFIREHNMECQISHDGCGQWMRTGEIDPLYDDRMADNIASLFRSGHLNMINDCLNFYNNSVFANKKYWDDYFKSINMPADKFAKLYIKLNRIYDGDYDVGKKNHLGIFGSDKRVWKELIDKPFGDMRHHNWKNLNSGNTELDHLFAHELDEYINDWYRLAMLMRDPYTLKDPKWKPYIAYISEQVNRWKIMPDRDAAHAICRRFQMTTSGNGKPEYWIKPNAYGEIENFVIDTKGGYCECNLIDSDHHVKNLGCKIVPKQCPSCRFYLQAECQGCGSEIFTEDCEFRFRWVSLLEQVKLLDVLLKNNNAVAFDKGRNQGRIDERTDIGAAILKKQWDDLGLKPLSNK